MRALRNLWKAAETLRAQRDAAVATEQNCREINNRLMAENAALKAQNGMIEEMAHNLGRHTFRQSPLQTGMCICWRSRTNEVHFD